MAMPRSASSRPASAARPTFGRTPTPTQTWSTSSVAPLDSSACTVSPARVTDVTVARGVHGHAAIAQPPVEPAGRGLAERALEDVRFRQHQRDVAPREARRRSELGADEAAADHEPAPAGAEVRTDPVGVGERAQQVDPVVEAGAEVERDGLRRRSPAPASGSARGGRRRRSVARTGRAPSPALR